MDFKKSSGYGSHEISSNQILVDKDTGRVVAVFYKDYDLDYVLGNDNRNSVIDEAIAAVRSCELVSEDVKRIRLLEAIGALCELKEK